MILLLLILFTNDVVIFNCCCIDVFVPFSVHEILSIFRQHEFSKASIFFMLTFLVVQIAAPYVGKTSASILLFSPLSLCFLSIFCPASLIIASLFLIFSLQSPFSAIKEPRKVKLETTSSSSLHKLNLYRLVDMFVCLFRFINKPASLLLLFIFRIRFCRFVILATIRVVSSA